MLGKPDHINVVVKDIAAAKAYYSEVVGLRIRDEFEISEPGLSKGLGVHDGAHDAILKVVFWDLPATEMTMEMVEYASPKLADEGNRAVGSPGYGHLAFSVDDIDAAHDALKARGAEFISEPVVVADGVRFCFFRDPEGNIIELIQPARTAGQRSTSTKG